MRRGRVVAALVLFAVALLVRLAWAAREPHDITRMYLGVLPFVLGGLAIVLLLSALGRRR